MKKKEVILFIIGFALLIPAFIEAVPLAVRIVCAAIVYFYFGFDVFTDMLDEFKEGEIFNEGFLMCAATVGAICIGEFADAAAVMILFALGEALGDRALDRSMESLEELIDLTPEFAYILKDNEKIRVEPSAIAIGDSVIVSAGERIPIDGVVTDGGANANYSSVTGESEPVSLNAGDRIISGGVIENGSVVFTADREYSNSTAAKMKAAMDEAAERKAPHERFVGRFAKYYTPAAIAVAVIVAVSGILLGRDVYESVKAGLVIMVISCPCALVLSVPLTYCAAMGKANRKGLIFKGGEAIERAAGIGTFVFDKTGTLTVGSPSVKSVDTCGVTMEEFGSIAYAVMKNSLHPLSVRYCESAKPSKPLASENAVELPGKGISAVVNGKTALAGNARLLEENGITPDKCEETAVYVSYDGKYIGRVVFEDTVKPGAADMLADIKKLGVGDVVVMSGDGKASVENTAAELGIERYYYGLLPDEKLGKFEEIYKEAKSGRTGEVAYCGDGLNDSAVIKRSDAGFAMGGDGLGIAASIEAADVVVGGSDVSKIAPAIRLAKRTVRKVKENIIFSLAVKAAIMIVSIFIYRNLKIAVAADVGVMLLCVLNAISI